MDISKVTYIGSWTFSNCYNFTHVTLPSTMTRINDGLFEYCYNLT